MGNVIYLDRIQVSVSAAVVACSVATASSYLRNEIFSEGAHRNDVPWWVVLPQQDAGQKSFKWVADRLVEMEILRQDKVNPYLIDVNERSFDIGLLDIQVFMDFESQDELKQLLQHGDSEDLLKHNSAHLDMLASAAINDQMSLFQTTHIFDPNGNLRWHYHNIILGLRRQGSSIGFLNMVPLLNLMNSKAKIGFVL